MNFKTFNKDKKYLTKILTIFSFILLDLLSKIFFEKYFTLGHEEFSILFGLIQFTYVQNTGAAFGSFSDSTIFLTIISAIFVIAIVVFDVYYKKQNYLYAFSFSLIVAGAIGNLVDRLFLHYVRDFIKFAMFNFVCNIADICICIGALLLIINMIVTEIKDKGKDNERQNNS